MLGTLKFASEPWQLIGKRGIVQMTGSYHYTNFQFNLQVQNKIPASRHLFFCRMAQNVFSNLNFRTANNPPLIKKFQKFCHFFLWEITSKNCWCRFMKNCDGNWDVLLAVTRVKYFACYLWSFSQVSLKQAIFFKNIVK